MVASFMPVLNEENGIRRAITSLQQQSIPVDKLIIVDGGSTDATKQVAQDMDSITNFAIDFYEIDGAGVRFSSQFGAEKAAEHLRQTGNATDGVILRLEGDSALEETFVETAINYLSEGSYSVFGAPVNPHQPRNERVKKRFFSLLQNSDGLPKGRGMAFKPEDFYAVNGYKIKPDERIQFSDIDCLEDGILVSKLQEYGEVAFCRDTCVYSTVPSTTATSPDRYLQAAKIEREIGPTNYFTEIINPINTMKYVGKNVAHSMKKRYIT